MDLKAQMMDDKRQEYIGKLNKSEETLVKQQKKRDNKSKQKIIKQNKKLGLDPLSDENSNEDDEDKLDYFMDDESLKLIRKLTKNYQLTYKQIQNKEELKQVPLKYVPKEDIQYLIRKERQNQRRNFGMNLDCKALTRTHPIYLEETDEELSKSTSPYKERSEELPKDQFLDLAKILIQDFNNLPIQDQKKIILSIASIVKTDEDLLKSSIEKQIQEYNDQCYLLMKDRKYFELTTLLKKISPMAAILMNLRLASQLEQLSDEGNTLVQTFLPYLKECTNYNFIPNELLSTANRFIHTLVQYFLDTDLTIDLGLAMFSLQFSPNLLQPTIRTQQDNKVLKQAFINIGFNDYNSKILSDHPQNFLWKEMLDYLLNQNKNEQTEYINIISKIIILQNPGSYLSKLIDMLVKRKVFTKSLLECQKIQLSIHQLIQVLCQLSSLETEAIKNCLSQDSLQWLKLSTSLSEKPVSKNEEMNEEQLKQFSEQYTPNDKVMQLKDIQDFIKSSKETEQLCENYQHNMYQCLISQIVASQQQNLVIIEMPTGSGKTWVQALIALNYIKAGQKVTIIEPNENLKEQTQELLQNLSHDLSFLTIDQFYEYPPEDEVIIVNEYDLILSNSAFKTVSYGLTGIWQLQNRKALLFTATTNKSTEKIIKHIFQNFQVLKFKSEFEIIKQVSAISQGEIKTFQNFEMIVTEIKDDIKKYYDEKPIIIFCEKQKEEVFINLLRNNNFVKFRVGYSQENLNEIRSWKYGILILNPDDGVGINTKFAVDSIVLITNNIRTEAQYLQTQGRSSRARGLCHSIYYVQSEQTPQVILRNMRNAHINEAQELERLLKVIWTKRNDQGLQNTIEDAFENNDKIKTLKDLESLMRKSNYQKLIKGISF